MKEANIIAVSSVTMYLVALCASVKPATPFRKIVQIVQVCMHSCQSLSLCVCVCVLLTMLSLRDCEYSEEELISFEIWSSGNVSLCGLFADVNECQSGRNNCSQTCSNTVGSFQCGCTTGYSLQEDRVTCTGMRPFMSTFAVVSGFPVHLHTSITHTYT